MIQVFDNEPQGIQTAPHDPRMIAAGYQVAVREIDFSGVRDKDSLMDAFLVGLGLSTTFGRNWDALFDVLTDAEIRPDKLALLLYDYPHFRKRHARLGTELEGVLLEAQTYATELKRCLWLLTEEPDHDVKHW